MPSQVIKVVHVITGLSLGGAETMLYNLLRHTDRERFRPEVVSLTPGGELLPRIEDLGVPVTDLALKPGVANPLALFTLYRHLRRVRPLLLQTWLYHADLVGTLVAPFSGVPGLCWNVRCSDMGETYYRGTTGLVVKALAALSRRPDAIVVNSRAGQREHDGFGYRPRRWEVIPNGVDLERFQPSARDRGEVRSELGIGAEAIVIGLVARLDPVKGHDVFLGAARIADESRDDVHFVLVGEGCERGNPVLEPLAAGLTAERLHLLGRRDDVARLTAAFDIACCSSYSEGFPNVLIEAMACGVPCAVTDVGDCAEIVADTGRVVAPGDARAFARSLTSLIEEGPDGRSALGRAARLRAIEQYGAGAVTARYENLYAGLSAAPRKAS